MGKIFGTYENWLWSSTLDDHQRLCEHVKLWSCSLAYHHRHRNHQNLSLLPIIKHETRNWSFRSQHDWLRMSKNLSKTQKYLFLWSENFRKLCVSKFEQKIWKFNTTYLLASSFLLLFLCVIVYFLGLEHSYSQATTKITTSNEYVYMYSLLNFD